MKKIGMNVHKSIYLSFLYLGPIAILIFIISHFDAYRIIGENIFSKMLGVVFILWLFSLIYVLAAVIFNKNFRESLFLNLAGIKERDEREELIVFKAMKSSFLLTLGVLTLLLVLSTTRTNINVNAKTEGHQKSSITLGHVDFSAAPIIQFKKDIDGKEYELKTYDIPLSKTTIILLIITTQLFSFHLFAKKISKEL